MSRTPHRHSRNAAIGLLVLASLAATCTGCIRKDQLVKHPDAPMLITDAQGKHLRVAVYERAGNRLVDYGWLPSTDAVGYTIGKYDWEAYIERQRNSHAAEPATARTGGVRAAGGGGD